MLNTSEKCTLLYDLGGRKLSEIDEIIVEPQLVLGMTKEGKYTDIAKYLPMLFHYALEKEAQFTGAPLFLCHETSKEEVEEADKKGCAKIELAIPIAHSIEESEDMKCYTLPGGSLAKIVHKGPYEACEPTYNQLFAWLMKNGKGIKGPLREVYLNDPKEIPPEEILTEIYAPLD